LPSAPEPAESRPPPGPPAGDVVAVAGEPEGIAISPARSVAAVAVRGARPGVDLLDAVTGQRRAFVPLAGTARHLELAGPDGPLLVPLESADRLDVLALPGGRLLESVPVGRQPHDAAAIGSTFMVGDELSNTVHLISGGHVTGIVAAPLQPGGLAAVDGEFVVVGVRARVVAAYRPDGSMITEATAGSGPTHVVAGADGYFYVADTLGGSLLVYHLSGPRLQRVGTVQLGRSSRPYGLASDPGRGWVFVTLTGTDQLMGLRFQDGRVTERLSWTTGRQPNSVAWDPTDRTAVVGDTASDEIEFIGIPEE
jgi:DNA-binding beta-propeller fold protein YncE